MNDLTNKWQKPFSDELRALGTDPIPAAPYHDPDWFRLECEAIFRRTWLNVGHACELPEPGSFIVVELEFARASIIIARGRDGVIRVSVRTALLDERFRVDLAALFARAEPFVWHGLELRGLSTLDLFVSLYGAEAGNLALRSLAVAGVYVGGGIAPKILSAIKKGSGNPPNCIR